MAHGRRTSGRHGPAIRGRRARDGAAADRARLEGLEWDVVGVPRLVDGEFPGTSRAGVGWLGFGELPYEFRGDAAELPELAWRGVDDQKDFDRRLAEFKAELIARHEGEERRLAYVAFTRAKDELLLSGSFWSSTVKPRRPSRISSIWSTRVSSTPPGCPTGPTTTRTPSPTSLASSRGRVTLWALAAVRSSTQPRASRV